MVQLSFRGTTYYLYNFGELQELGANANATWLNSSDRTWLENLLYTQNPATLSRQGASVPSAYMDGYYVTAAQKPRFDQILWQLEAHQSVASSSRTTSSTSTSTARSTTSTATVANDDSGVDDLFDLWAGDGEDSDSDQLSWWDVDYNEDIEDPYAELLSYTKTGGTGTSPAKDAAGSSSSTSSPYSSSSSSQTRALEAARQAAATEESSNYLPWILGLGAVGLGLFFLKR